MEYIDDENKFFIYIVLSASCSIIAKCIRFFKRDRYSHASLSLDRELNRMYSFARKWTHFPFYGCFVQERLDRGLFGLCRHLPGKVIRIEVTREQYHRAERLMEYLSKNRRRYGYNYVGLLLNIINVKHSTLNRYTCSEFVAYALDMCSPVHLTSRFGSLIRPMDLSQLGELYFEGDLRDYHRWLAAKALSPSAAFWGLS